MKNLKIKFLNHASFYIETESSLTLVDPWYFGKIFNNSWSLLKDTDDSGIDYSKLKYITISHEHPDHLHWPTLKHIRSKTDNNIKILFPKRNNPNVMNECIKLGYEFEYIDYYKKLQLEKDYFLCAFPDELIQQKGWKEGTVLNLEVRQTPSGNVLVITEKK